MNQMEVYLGYMERHIKNWSRYLLRFSGRPNCEKISLLDHIWERLTDGLPWKETS